MAIRSYLGRYGIICALVVSTRASWSHSQRDAARDNSASGMLPDLSTGVKATSVLNGPTSHGPVYHTAKGALVATTPCRIIIATAALDRTLPWDFCNDSARNITGIALHDADIDLLVVLTNDPQFALPTNITGLSATPENPGITFTHTLDVIVRAEPVIFDSTAFLVAYNGTIVMLDLSKSGLPSRASGIVSLCGPDDSINQPPVLIDPIGLFLAVSQSGCATLFDSRGGNNPEWKSLPLLSPTDRVHVAPASDSLGHAFIASASGMLCCLAATNYSHCQEWASACVQVTSRESQLPTSGLAVSPSSFDYHGGQVYMLGADGTLFSIRTRTGAVMESAQPVAAPPIMAPPVLVPNGWGPHNSALLILSGPLPNQTDCPVVLAMSVGNNGAVDDDDGMDDDGNANSGVVWTAELPPECGRGLLFGGISVNDEGRIFLPCPTSIVAIDPAEPDPLPPGAESTEEVIVASCVAAAVAGIVFVGFIACRKGAQSATHALDRHQHFTGSVNGPNMDEEGDARGLMHGGVGIDDEYVAVEE